MRFSSLFVPAVGSLVILVLSWSCQGADDLQLCGDTVLHFATVDEAKKILTARDSFAHSLSKFDLQVRLQRVENATLAELDKLNEEAAIPWQNAGIERVRPAVEKLQARLRKYRLPLPKKILLIHTTGREEGEAAYTRANAIILPTKVLKYQLEQMESLLAHELFHVLSRQNPELRSALYGVIGFRLCDEIQLPESFKDRKLTNPDAPLIDCFIELPVEGKKVLAAPILYSNSKAYDPKKGGTLFSYLTFRLMVVERKGDKLVPVLNGENPVVFEPAQVPQFFGQVGSNTTYIIHPDEILADNFMHLVKESKDLQTPRLIDRIGSLLSN